MTIKLVTQTLEKISIPTYGHYYQIDEEISKQIEKFNLVGVSKIHYNVIAQCANLKELGIKRSEFSDSEVTSFIQAIKDIKSLAKLSLKHNDLTATGARELLNYLNVQTIKLGGNYINAAEQAELSEIAAKKNVQLSFTTGN